MKSLNIVNGMNVFNVGFVPFDPDYLGDFQSYGGQIANNPVMGEPNMSDHFMKNRVTIHLEFYLSTNVDFIGDQSSILGFNDLRQMMNNHTGEMDFLLSEMRRSYYIAKKQLFLFLYESLTPVIYIKGIEPPIKNMFITELSIDDKYGTGGVKFSFTLTELKQVRETHLRDSSENSKPKNYGRVFALDGGGS